MLRHQVHTLPNKLKCIIVPMPAVKSVTVLALANTGSRFEKPNEAGIAHFLEHMVFKGTEKYPEAQILAASIDEIGADFNAFTSKEYTGYYVKAASNHLDRALDVVSDMLMTPKLRQEDIDREKGVIVEEINMYADTPMRHVSTIFEELFFSDSLGRDVLGTKKTVNSFTSEDFTQFLNTWYKTGNLVVIIAGDEEVVTAQTLEQKVAEYFAKGKREIGEKAATKDLLLSDPINKTKLKIEYKKTEQAHLVLGWPAFGRHNPDKHVLSVLSTILGGNMSSRLFTEVREKRGLCYYVHSDNDHYHETGVFGASAGVDPQRIFEAIEVIKEQFMSVKNGVKPITAEELRKAKEYIVGTTVLGLEDSRSVAQYYGMRQLLLDKIETPEEILEKIKAVTLEQINELIKKIIVEGEMRLAVIGPFKNQGEFEKFIK